MYRKAGFVFNKFKRNAKKIHCLFYYTTANKFGYSFSFHENKVKLLYKADNIRNPDKARYRKVSVRYTEICLELIYHKTFLLRYS